MKTELGGDRLGSGNKQEISMRNYERSSHDLGYIWRSSMASGTLVPFMSEVGLPGDSFDIDLEADVKTLPTVGPLFGSYKVQLDIFQCPVRLYQGKLHMNMLNIGMDMAEVQLPQLRTFAEYDALKGDNQQVNSSCILSYLNIRGLGKPTSQGQETVRRDFNAVPFLGYWDIYKNYYSNKQEERGFVIHNNGAANDWDVLDCGIQVDRNGTITNYPINGTANTISVTINDEAALRMNVEWGHGGTAYGMPDVNTIQISIDGTLYYATDLWAYVSATATTTGYRIDGDGFQGPYLSGVQWIYSGNPVANTVPVGQGEPVLEEFPLENIDDMRMTLLEAVRQTTPVLITNTSVTPYSWVLGDDGEDEPYYFKLSSQEGLGIKTYQSDLFNNWISTEWIDGTNGINEVTAVSTTGNSFTIDSLNLANKVYNMLNRIAISGGTYDDWLDAVYTHERAKGHENPIYHGSLIKELAFEEVVSHSDVTDTQGVDQPLGTLAGRGRLTQKDKGGKVKIKIDEPSYIMGIVSITPRVDYSQGNKWDVNLKTMNDLHKPALDAIGFQDLITDQMAWFDTGINNSHEVTYSSAGKQPAWINYMTNVNQTRGSFAEVDNSMFMTLNRRYEQDNQGAGIDDLTTYIDPSKYNNIFAQTSLDSQNFWVQIRVDNFARRKMSAKVIPNL
jgi:hypothetical protein